MEKGEQTVAVKGVNMPKTKLGLAKMERIVEAAQRLFTEGSFFETSISDICRAAGSAVGTFYIYFDSKTDLYRFLVERYKQKIRLNLAESIAGCNTRLEMEKEGIKSFIRFSVSDPNVYKIIWGSLAVDKETFKDYYVSFAESYAHALKKHGSELKAEDASSLAYMLMGITNFLGLKAIFEGMDESRIDEVIETAVLPVLREGMFT